MGTLAEAFVEYVRPHWQRLHVAAGRYAAREPDAHDLVQETLLRAWRGFSPADDRTYRRAWLFVILRNVALEWHRTATRRIRLVPVSDAELTEVAAAELSEPMCPLPTMSEDRFCEFLDDRIVAALDGLDGPFREVVLLSVAGGLSYREIAEVLDCPVGTVMSRMARARRALRERLAEFAPAHRRERGLRS
ncbi:MAG: sigma-70 family RNA polymerase sigma factor [Phycisphaerae bacterium]